MYTCNGNPIFYLFDATDMLTILNDKEKKRVCTDKKSSTWCRLRNMFFHDCQHRTMKRNCKATCHFCRKLNNCLYIQCGDQGSLEARDGATERAGFTGLQLSLS